MRHLPSKTESGLCLRGTSQLDQDSVKAGSSCPCSCCLRRMKGVTLLEPLSHSLYGITVSNRLPQTLSRSPWAWREVTSPGGGLWKSAQSIWLEWVQGFGRSFPKSPLKGFWQHHCLWPVSVRMQVSCENPVSGEHLHKFLSCVYSSPRTWFLCITGRSCATSRGLVMTIFHSDVCMNCRQFRL